MFDEGSTSDPHHTPRIDAPRTRQHTEARFVLVSRALPGLPTSLPQLRLLILSLSFCLLLRLPSSFFLPSLFAHFARSGFLPVSLSLSLSPPCLSTTPPPSLTPFPPSRRTVYPYVRETDRRVRRRHGPEMGIDGESRRPVTSRRRVREYGSTRRILLFAHATAIPVKFGS